ncbi:MAG: ABC transporter substrate-binding protein [Actinobacteria bacterium]|nr:ABC transporter substrate-binding protein [Actinomycetota bacterium]
MGGKVLRGKYAVVATAAVGTLVFAAGCSSGGSSGGSSSSTTSKNVSTATSASAAGGMSALVAAAKKEGTLNVITLPSDWANYGTIMKDFTAKYGIKINDANPDGSSQDEINAMTQLKGQSRAPDVLDMGTAFAVKADQSGLLAPYKVASWANIPSNSKATDATYYADYGGYVAIGYNSAKVTDPPTSLADLEKPEYKNEVAINGNPTQAGAAFAAVYAAALANGGSFSNIAPGVAYFKKLHSEGNFVPVTASAATMESGQTPIIIWWDYLLASEVGPGVKGLKITIPTDSHYAAYYDQAISKTAPDPAAARLWEEYLYSTTGQNLWLEGKARPIELPTLVSSNTVNQAALKALPPAPSTTLTFPSIAQQNAAETVVSQQWPSVSG